MKPFPLSNTREINGWLSISGQLGIRDGKLVDGGFSAQAEQSFANFHKAVADAGFSDDSIIRVCIYLTDISTLVEMNSIYEKYFRSPFPTRTTIEVSQLPLGGQIEIDGWAAKISKITNRL